MTETGTTFGSGHGIYFISYASMATIAFIIVAIAQYKRKKDEGIAVNFNILKIVGGIAIAMWTSAALTSATYTTNPTTTAVAAFCVGIIFSIFVAWQMGKIVRKMSEDEKTIRELSTHCSLTNLWNRRVFQEKFAAEVKRSRRHDHPLSLLLFDVEGLGMINRMHGYQQGDKALIELSDILTEATRANDVVCRYAGSQIAMILPDTPLEDAEMFANRLRKKIADRQFEAVSDSMASITVRGGVSGYSDNTNTDDAIILAAHDALKAAQEAGPNKIKSYKNINVEEKIEKGTYPDLPKKLELAIPVIDKDHDKLYSYIREFTEAEKSNDLSIIEPIFSKLLEYTKFHFRREEAGLDVCGYEELHGHSEEHHKLEGEVLTIHMDMLIRPETFNSTRLKEIRTFLMVWLGKHIVVTDMLYRDAVLASPQAQKAMEDYDFSEYKTVA